MDEHSRLVGERRPKSRSGSLVKMTRTPSAATRYVDYAPMSYQSYGSTRRRKADSAMLRSSSMPVQSHCVVFIRRQPRQLTVGQQSAKLVEESKRSFFHGNFTSAHGAVFTVPNRAQQMATGRPSRAPSLAPRGSLSRSTSVAHRAAPIALDAPTTSALKRPGHSGNLSFDTNEPHTGGMFDGQIVVKKRAVSADARVMTAFDDHAGSSFASYGHHPVPCGSTIFRQSAPDLFAMERMREATARQEAKNALSATTIAKAKRALRAFEEKKVRMPNSSFDNGKAVAVDGKVLPLPEKSPLVLLARPGAGAVRSASMMRRVQINSDIDEGVSQASYDDGTSLDDEEDGNIGICAAVMDLLYLAAPAAVSLAFTFSMSVVPLAFVGSMLGERELSGASVGYFITCILIFYPMVGLTFAMDTLISHEYGRDPLSPEMGLVLQRGVLINIILLTPLCFIIYNLKPFLVHVYGESTASVAVDFLHFAPLYLFPIMLFIAFNKFLNNQMLPHIPMIALTAGVILMPILQVKLTPMGVRYTMLGMGITAWFQFVVVIVLTLFKPQTRITLGTWRIRDALDWADVKTYMKLAIPSAIFVAAEASSFDLTVLLCAQFSDADGAAWSAIMNSLFIFAAISGGLSASACANIGRCIGADQPLNAKRYVLLSIFIAFVIGIVDSVILVACYNGIMSLFGTQGKALQLAHEVLFMLPFFHIADSVQFTFQGIFSGLGKNHLGAIILLTSLWCIGIPLSFLFGQYLGYNMFGVCVGLTIGLCIEAPAMVMAASTMDYQLICDRFLEDEATDDDEEDEEDEEDDEEESTTDEEYVEEVMRRSGISINSNELTEEASEKYRKLRPPTRRGRKRQALAYEDEDSD